VTGSVAHGNATSDRFKTRKTEGAFGVVEGLQPIVDKHGVALSVGALIVPSYLVMVVFDQGIYAAWIVVPNTQAPDSGSPLP
jgi:hypothetical protein